MGTLAEEAAYLSGTQAILKSKIASNLGRTIPDNTNFRDYQNYILPPVAWMPDPLWASLDDITDGQIGMIVRDRDDLGVAARCAFTITATASYVVDWGDGTAPETVASTVMADHTYTLNAGTPDSKGTTTFKVRISSIGTIQRIQMANNVVGGVVKQTVQTVNIKAAGITTMSFSYYYCSMLQHVYDLYLPLCASMQNAFFANVSLESVGTFLLQNCASMNSTFALCGSLREIGDLNLPACQTLTGMLSGALKLSKIGVIYAPLCASLNTFCYQGYSISQLGDMTSIGLNATTVDGSLAFSGISGFFTVNMPNAKFTKIEAYGSSSRYAGITGLIFNASSPFSGTSPQINVSYTMMDRTALVALFSLLPTLTGKTINITGCIGTAGLTADDRAIATGKGWTITG